MTQHHSGQLKLLHKCSAASSAALRILAFVVIACHPHPIERSGQRVQHARCMGFQPSSTLRIVEIVTQSIDPACARFPYRMCESLQRFAAVIGRQHLAMACKKAGLFQMQIGHQQSILTRPEQRPPA